MNIKNKKLFYSIAVVLIVVFSTNFALLMTLERTEYRNYLQGVYSKNMYELINSLNNIRSGLTKAGITGSNEQAIILFSDIFRYSYIASDKLSSLPIGYEVVGSTNKLLTQIGDFSDTMKRKIIEGDSITEEEYETIEKLKLQSLDLQTDLSKTMDEINAGKVKWGEIRKKVHGVLGTDKSAMVSKNFQDIQKQVEQYPSLIYDGPFSDNIQAIAPRINSEALISKEQAIEKVKSIIGENRISNIEETVNHGQKLIEAYHFVVKIKDRKDEEETIVCEISKKGGGVLYLLDNRKVGKATLDLSKATEKGLSFMEAIGIKNMIPSYTANYGNTMVINYIYEEKNVLMYPDQIKLKIALDDGSIIGIESEKYLISHSLSRELPQPKISLIEAKKKVSSRLDIKKIRLAVIPTESSKELFCYEFYGKYKNDNFLVYINANTGIEIKTLEIILEPSGNLAM